MNLKKQLRAIIKQTEEERKKSIRDEDLIRTSEDWKIIDEYLQELLKKLASGILVQIGRKKFIRLDFYSNYLLFPLDKEEKHIFLKDGSRLQISYKDMQKFCKQHGLKLYYINSTYSITKKYDVFCKAYLIGI